MLTNAIRVSAKVPTVWNLVRTLDFSFLHPRLDASLQQAVSKIEPCGKDKTADKANSSLSAAPEWTKVGSVRNFTVSSTLNTNVAEASQSEFIPPFPDLFYLKSVKLVDYDEAAKRVQFEILEPTTMPTNLPSLSDLASKFADAQSGIQVPNVHVLTVKPDGESEASAVVELSCSAPATDSISTAVQRFHNFILGGLRDALAAPYPPTPRRLVYDNYHGVTVADPYRWLEDPDSPETKAWVDTQNELSSKVLATCEMRNRINDRLKEMYTYERFSRPFKHGQYYYYYRNDGLQDHPVLWQTTSLDDPGREFLNMTVVDPKGTTALKTTAFSKSGRYCAYSLAKNGSDWNIIYVKNSETLEEYKDELHWVRFSSISWTHDEKGFFYSRYPAPESIKDADIGKRGTETDMAGNQTVYYHALGTSQDDDVAVFSCPENPAWMMSATVSECGKYVTVSISDSCDPVNRFQYAPLNNFTDNPKEVKLEFVKLVDNFKAQYSYITNIDKYFYFVTNLDAPRYRVIKVDITAAAEAKDRDPELPPLGITEVLPEPEGRGVLSTAQTAGGKLLAVYNIDVCDYIRFFNLADGTPDESIKLDLPSYVSVGVSSELDQDEIFIQITSMLHAGRSYVYNLKTGEQRVFKDSKPNGFDPEKFVAKQVFYPSKDGEKIPMFIVHRRDIELNGQNPTYLYGYGGFNITLGPAFVVTRWMWMEHFRGVIAVPNLRGGGEYGEEWHKAGSLLRKQNVFDDFQAAAEYLIANKYTSPKHLAIHGGSNGGLLVAACVNQRPDLYGAAVAAVGVLDMLRFHKFTIGYAWCSDYGNAETNEEDFKYLYKYSPLHNVNKYCPALMLTTADHDDRVVPLHSLKYIAQLQRVVGTNPHQNPESGRPAIIRVETNAGHGAGKPLSKQIAEHADVFSFFAKYTGAQWA